MRAVAVLAAGRAAGDVGQLDARARAAGSGRCSGRCEHGLDRASRWLARSRTVGTAFWASGRSWTRNFWSLGATGLDALTSGVSAFSELRRLTNVVSARRHEAGQLLDRLAQRGLLRGQRLGGRAEVLDQRAQVGLARGDVGEQVPGLDDELVKCRRVLVELVEQRVLERHRRVQVLPGVCAFLPLPAYWEAVPWIRFWRPFRVGGFSVLNSSSRSTSLVVCWSG